MTGTTKRRNTIFRGIALGLLTMLVSAGAASAALASPVTWVPSESTYGEPAASFMEVPSAPGGTGMTQHAPGVAYGAGFWMPETGVFSFGFMGQLPAATGSLPSIDQTEVATTLLGAGTPVSLVFHKAAGTRIDSISVTGEPDAPVSVDPIDPEALTAADMFTVRATVTDPVASASGDVGAAFGLVIDLSLDPARFQHGSVFVTDMHWLDVHPPTFSAAGLVGLSAHGANGSLATVDGLLSPMFLDMSGIADPTLVRGYVDITAATGWTGATFTPLGAGDGGLWPTGYYKYRITNNSWSTHNILFGRLAKPAKAVGLSPKGTIASTRPMFKWKKLATAKSYEVRVYKGSTLILRKTGATALSWKASKALPRKVYLTWKVRGVNSAGPGSLSTALKFKIS